MRKIIVALGIALCNQAFAVELPTISFFQPNNIINWTVGDTASYSVTLGAMGNIGSMVKTVAKLDEPRNALWVKTATKMYFQNDVTEMLISRADGKVLQFLHNGKEESFPDPKVEVVSQDYAQVTVPAGTFQSVHIVANTEQVKGVEIWVNPKDTVMEGMLKQTMPTQFGIVSVELTSFKKAGESVHILPVFPCQPNYMSCEE